MSDSVQFDVSLDSDFPALYSIEPNGEIYIWLGLQCSTLNRTAFDFDELLTVEEDGVYLGKYRWALESFTLRLTKVE